MYQYNFLKHKRTYDLELNWIESLRTRVLADLLSFYFSLSYPSDLIYYSTTKFDNAAKRPYCFQQLLNSFISFSLFLFYCKYQCYFCKYQSYFLFTTWDKSSPEFLKIKSISNRHKKLLKLLTLLWRGGGEVVFT